MQSMMAKRQSGVYSLFSNINCSSMRLCEQEGIKFEFPLTKEKLFMLVFIGNIEMFLRKQKILGF